MPSDDPANDTPTGDVLGKGRGSGWVAAQFVLAYALVLAPQHIDGLPIWPPSLRLPSMAVGLLLGVIGAAIGFVSLLTLGRSFTVFPQPKADGALVEQGIYGLVRHPIYSSLLLCTLGWALLRTSLLSLMIVLLLAVLLDLKARREEIWLEQKYPAYREYRARVRRLIPWIY